MGPSSFKDMPIWQQSMQLAVNTCQLCMQLPNQQKLVLSAQIQEAVLAIPTTLARGSKGGRSGMLRALASARQTTAELETLLIALQNLYNDKAIAALHDQTVELQAAISQTGRRLGTGRPPQDI